MRTVNGLDIYSELSELLRPEHTALLVVDMQNDFCRSDGWMARNGRSVDSVRGMVPRLTRLLEAARSVGVRVVFLQQTTLPDNASDPPAWLYFKTRDGRTATDYTLEGSWGQEIIAELNPLDQEPRVRKFRPSGFHETELDLLLRAAEVATVVVSGAITQGCVVATTLDASFHGYYTVVAEDCIQSFSEEQHEIALRFLRSRYDVVSSERIIAEGGWKR